MSVTAGWETPKSLARKEVEADSPLLCPLYIASKYSSVLSLSIKTSVN
jgi:hypothetical protein